MITSNSGIIILRLLFAFLLLVNFSNAKAQVLVADINQAKGGETPVKILVNESQLFFTTATERGPQSRIYETYNEADDAQLIFDLEDHDYGLWIEHAKIVDSIIYISTLTFDSSFFLTLNVNSNTLRKVTSIYYDGHSGLDIDNFIKLNNKVFFTMENTIYVHNLGTSDISKILYNNNLGRPLRLSAYLDKIMFVNRLKEYDEIWIIDETTN